jgi:hypothetical protein
MAWMYENDILNKTEKAKKDTIFSQYYRYYNDGDFPRSLASKGLNKYSNEKDIELGLETLIEDFIKSILSKYSGKYNRTEFKYDSLLGDLFTLSDVLKRYDIYGFINYWSKTVRLEDTEFTTLLDQLKSEYNIIKPQVVAIGKSNDLNLGNTTLSYCKIQLEKINKWTPKLETLYNQMQNTMDKIGVIINNVIRATQLSKKLLNN